MWHIRGFVSHLIAAGHDGAPDYPIVMVFDEIDLVVERENRQMATFMTLFKIAIDTGIAAFGKKFEKANKNFADLMVKLSGNGDPEPERKHLGELHRGEAAHGAKRRRTSDQSPR